MRHVLSLIPDAEVKRSLLNAKSDRGTVLHVAAAKKFHNDQVRAVYKYSYNVYLVYSYNVYLAYSYVLMSTLM